MARTRFGGFLAAVALLWGAGCGSVADPGDSFEAAARTFHGAYDPLIERLTAHLGLGDPAAAVAVGAANELADAFDAYGDAVEAIDFPEGALAAADDLGKAIDAGDVVAVAAVDTRARFTTDALADLVERFRPVLDDELTTREDALRTALRSA